MEKIIKAYGIPLKLVNAIMTMYDGTKAKVITTDGDKKTFNIQTGVLQGDTLVTYLFAIVLDYTMRKAFAFSDDFTDKLLFSPITI